MNVSGVHSMLELCKQLPSLVAFIHISTAYANCDKEMIKEEIYEPPLKPKQLLNACGLVLVLNFKGMMLLFCFEVTSNLGFY